MFRSSKFGGIAKILVILTIIVIGSIKINSISFKSYSDMLEVDKLADTGTEAPESFGTKVIDSPSNSHTMEPGSTPPPSTGEALKPSQTLAEPSAAPTPQVTPSPTPDIIASEDIIVQSGDAFIDPSTANEGYIYCAFNTTKYSLIMLELDGVFEYNDLKHDGTLERVSLTGGSGDYRVVIYENISGDSFRTIEAVEFTAEIKNELMPFMVPTTMVYYDNTMQCIQMASWISDNESDSEDTARVIYEWIVDNVVYDLEIYGTLKAGYIPDAEYTYISKKGICYDFAVLYAAMCRSQHIPCRVAHGYSDNVSGFHAWNEVYFDGEYHVVDTSTDSQIHEMPFTREDGYYPDKYS